METHIISSQVIDFGGIHMNEEKIIKSEVDLLSIAIERIVSSEVLQSVISEQLPLTSDLTDSNKIYRGKVSVLFVDMRESTKLPEKFNAAQLVKIYRSYIRTVVQAIRYSGGVVRDFMGDGVLAVFVDNTDGKSEDKAVRAARYITTVVDKLLNPVLDREIKHRISCGIGIHTGGITLSKVGMKGKEKQENAEDEFGIAWIGNSTNLACKFSGAVGHGAIFICSSTYSALTDINGKQNWKWVEISKGSNVLRGYIAQQYYLRLDDDIEPCVAEENEPILSLVDELKTEYHKQFAVIAQKAQELGRKEQALIDKENRVNETVAEINKKAKETISKEQSLNRDAYRFYLDVLRSGYCKSAYAVEMGEDFWEENLDELILAGEKIGKDEHTVKQEISYAMVSIYQSLGEYDKAYDFLVEQATGYAWLLLYTVQDIVPKVGYCERLKSALYKRLGEDGLSAEDRAKFTRIKDWLVFEYRK